MSGDIVMTRYSPIRGTFVEDSDLDVIPNPDFGVVVLDTSSAERIYGHTWRRSLSIPESSLNFGDTAKIDRDHLDSAIQALKESMSMSFYVAHIHSALIDLADTDHLSAALEELDGVGVEAREENLPVPSEQMVTQARQLVHVAGEHFPGQKLTVYPDERGICIYAPGGESWSFIAVCCADGSILFSASRPERSWQVRFEDYDAVDRSKLLLKALHDNKRGPAIP